MSATDPAALAVLMALRVKGRAAPTSLAAAAALPLEAVRTVLERAHARGDVGGTPESEALALTDGGRAELATLLAAEHIDRAALGVLYERFLALDATVKARITARQLSGRAPATPEAGRWAGGDELEAAARDAAALAGDLAAVAPRYAAYARRLDDARRAIAAGDGRFVASPFVDSLHQVWFELHEDLLVTLGLSRRS